MINMAYYFAVETTKDNFLAINARKTGFNASEEVKCVRKEQSIYQFTLEEINKYTTRFRNKEHLIDFLLSQKIIDGTQSEQRICIVYSENKEKGCRSIPGNFIYRPYKEYLNNPLLVIEYVLNRANNYDHDFFYELSNFVPKEKEKNDAKDNFYSLGLVISSAFCSKDARQEMIQMPNSIDGSFNVLDIIQSYLITTDKKTRRKKINYEHLHILVSFISSYDEKLAKIKEENKGNTKTRKPETGSNI